MLFPEPYSNGSKYPETTGYDTVTVKLIRSCYRNYKPTKYPACNALNIELLYREGDFDNRGIISNIYFSDGSINGSGTINAETGSNKSWGPVSTSYAQISIDTSNIAFQAQTDGSLTARLKYYRCVNYGYNNGARGCKTHSYDVGFYKISNVQHGTPHVEYNGAQTTIGGIESDPITIVSESDALTFVHKLGRSDNWADTSISAKVYKHTLYTIDSTGNKKEIRKDSNYQTASLRQIPSYGNITETINVSQLGLESRKTLRVCSELEHYTKIGLSGYNPSDKGSDTSLICVYVKDNRIIYQADSYTGVTLPDSASAGTWSDTAENNAHATAIISAGSQGNGVYPIIFTHALQVDGDTSESKSFNLVYTIDQQEADGAVTNINFSDDSKWAEVDRGNVNNLTSGTGASYVNPSNINVLMPDLTVGVGETRTICQRITFAKRTFVFRPGGTIPLGQSGTGRSIACATIQRSRPTTDTLYGTTEISIDGGGYTSSPSGTYFVSGASGASVRFKHTLKHNTDSATVNANYTTVTTYGSSNDTVNSPSTVPVTTAGREIETDSRNFNPDPGDSKRICGHINFSPLTYYVHSDGSIQEDYSTSGSSSEVCTTITRPFNFRVSSIDGIAKDNDNPAVVYQNTSLTADFNIQINKNV